MKKHARQIIKIDEAKCNGCGACVPACKEGVLKIIDGKARLVSEIYCDGLGACLGECPTGALTIETRSAEHFDESAVAARLGASSATPDLPCGCPGTMVRTIGCHPEWLRSLPAGRQGSRFTNYGGCDAKVGLRSVWLYL